MNSSWKPWMSINLSNPVTVIFHNVYLIKNLDCSKSHGLTITIVSSWLHYDVKTDSEFNFICTKTIPKNKTSSINHEKSLHTKTKKIRMVQQRRIKGLTNFVQFYQGVHWHSKIILENDSLYWNFCQTWNSLPERRFCCVKLQKEKIDT